eukprot:TRINITY_DN13074_c0_g1_i3.p1 TRINITY_DN13074_c0_g1~~TRINITY_DN13074_c0_g1_i3.p1  ORF type:complete len:636 (+),score=158.63 TRINITY_DN13074_c0_g1_i3:153-2060(+)
MSLSDQLTRCLSELQGHFQALQQQNDALREESSALRLALPSALKDGAWRGREVNGSGYELPGTVKAEHPFGKPPAVPPPNGDCLAYLSECDRVDLCREPSTDFTSSPNHELLTAYSFVAPDFNGGNEETQDSDGDDDIVDPRKNDHFSLDEMVASEERYRQHLREPLGRTRLRMMSERRIQEIDEQMKPVKGLQDVLKAFEIKRKTTFYSTGRLGCTKLLVKIAHSMIFRAVCISAIIANTVYIGLLADHSVKNSFRRVYGDGMVDDFVISDLAFALWFSVELIIRIGGEGASFFTNEESRWNLFDLLLVMNSVIELMFPQVTNLSFLRILRVFRLVRVVRVVRTVKALKSLRTMVFALLNSFRSLMWAFVMIIMIEYIFGVVFTIAIATFVSDLSVDDAEFVEETFGSLYETMVSLFCVITGGNDWMEYGHRLRIIEYGEVWFALLVFYVGFCLVGMLNVVTGIFVDSAVCTRTQDEVVDSYQEDLKATTETVKQIFMEADAQEAGKLTYAELVKQLRKPWVKAYFAGLAIDPSEAIIIFTLMDTDGNKEVSLEEFVEGTMKLKGHAKSIDVLSIMFDNVRFSKDLKKALDPKAPAPARRKYARSSTKMSFKTIADFKDNPSRKSSGPWCANMN